tara:strand:- start:2331 stop:2921 length:591 start_codon:yes stop_codon:yes gene_type:complete
VNRGRAMSNEKLRKLLDGELDLSEAANDPILSSLASRIYNIDMSEVEPAEDNNKEVLEKSNLAFELHHSDSPDALKIELPELPPLEIPKPDEINETPKTLKISVLIMMISGPVISLCGLLNIFGFFKFLKSCEKIVANNGVCIEGADRLSWLAIGRLNHTEGWVYSGSFGIPTIILIIFGVILLFIGIQLRMYSKN